MTPSSATPSANGTPRSSQPGRCAAGYVKPGDTVLVVLPHTKACRKQQLAGRRTRLTVGTHDAELDLFVGPGQLRLPHPDAGIYRDPATERLYILQPAEPGGQPSRPEAP